MERAPILKWRIAQERAQVEYHEKAAIDRHTARQIRPLLTNALEDWVYHISGQRNLANVEGIPVHRIICDRESTVFMNPIRDYLTTKAFMIPSISGIFVITIDHRYIALHFITIRYRIRGHYEGDYTNGTWYPPGVYTHSAQLAYVKIIPSDSYKTSICELLKPTDEQKSIVEQESAQAERSRRIYTQYQWVRQGLLGIGYGLYIFLFLWILVWFALALFG